MSSFKLLRSLSKKVWSGRGTPEEHGIKGDAHEPKDVQAVNLMREALFQKGELPEDLNDFHTLLRFLRMRGYDVLKAKDSFLKCLKWREEFGVYKLAKEFEFEEYGEVQRSYPHGFHGVDKCGRPVYIERIGALDLETLLQKTTLDRLVKHHVCQQEKTSHLRFPACTITANKKIASITAIIDVTGVGTSSFSKPARYLFTEFHKIDSNYYPETLSCLFIVNAGSGFRILWKLIKTFIDARTSAKIQVLGNDFKSKLVEAIDPSNLPDFLGGECKCPDHGGCMFSDKGPWNDPSILELLQTVEAKDEDKHTTVEDVWFSAQSTPDNRNEQTSKERANITLSQKFDRLQVTAAITEQKIRAVEAAVEETKQVLQKLSRQINDIINHNKD
ncbi:phosphatidylinositol/phosphatidylcholine transfer protein SFH11-like [Silene latifolia]|uniref:phosphatidylinositol/phosphatidylcholine transfer protein SFH11-like n=1 Tax=Silene latifolia TaxID=37657 RepID=UPI003D76E9B0